MDDTETSKAMSNSDFAAEKFFVDFVDTRRDVRFRLDQLAAFAQMLFPEFVIDCDEITSIDGLLQVRDIVLIGTRK